METYIQKLEKLYTSSANEQIAAQQSAYLKNLFAFAGLKTPVRRAIDKQFIKENGLPQKENLFDLIKLLWNKDEREFQHFALDMLVRFKKKIAVEDMEMIEFCITRKSWWDTVDLLATHLAGKYFQKFPELTPQITTKWMNSNNIWLQRTAILFQLKYKEKTDFQLLCSFIIQLEKSNEFFIKKAIGWALREYSKTNEKKVTQFVETSKISDFSKKEALKWLNNKKK